MKKVIFLVALVLSGCELTPEQVASMRAAGQALSEAAQQDQQRRDAQYAAQMQYLQNNRPQFTPVMPLANPNPPTIKVMPVDGNGTPVYGQPQYLP